ncbi:hypothetical protein P3T73_15630 [Kiritimatiellota bacterium B12222]|nr:hypothetical protein P3T73_15630 [Kiritimatiellota bacterium B12222]
MSVLTEFQRLYRENLLGHAYLCIGDPLAEGKAFSAELAAMLLSEGKPEEERVKMKHRVDARLHPDVHWVEPRGKLRQIKVEDVQLTLKRIHEKSFEGGWKLVVFLSAERLNPSSGNKLLKSLEEPPPKTLILLVSDSPEQLLDTLRSRCQTVHLPRALAEDAPWRRGLVELLCVGPPRNLRARLERAAQFRDFFEVAARYQLDLEDAEASEEEPDEDVEKARMSDARRKMQRAVMVAVEEWYRDVMVCKQVPEPAQLRYESERAVLQQQAEKLPMHAIEKIISNIRTASRRMTGNLPVQVVLEEYVF